MASNPYQTPQIKVQNVSCSFFRKSYRDVGSLVERPGEIFTCRSCAELCMSIIDDDALAEGIGSLWRQRFSVLWSR